MALSRLSTALAEGLLLLPDGPVTVLRPPAGMDLSALPRGGLRIVTTWKPDHDAWAAAGHAVATEAGPAAMALVSVPRSKRLAHALIGEAARIAPLVAVDGARTDGVDSLWREVRAHGIAVTDLAKAHGRLFWFAPGRALDAWQAPPPARGPDGFWRQAGVFSEGGIDRGSALLAAGLPTALPARMADLGAGWGYLSAAVLARSGVVSLDLIEAEARALDCAKASITDPRAQFHWADVTTFVPAQTYDGIVMNPPFHGGTRRAADPAFGRAFIAAAARMLAPGGQLWMVANRHLGYESSLNAHFRQVTDIGGDPSFRLIHAARPKR
jgi:16S rRNA (guanine1207-N2)-methyltransferase